MELVCGTVKATGKKKNVIAMFDSLFDYYDKYMTAQYGSSNDYTIEFDFCSKIVSFFNYGDYFLEYSKDYECKIVSDLTIEEDEDTAMHLEYDNGEIIHGMSEYNIDEMY